MDDNENSNIGSFVSNNNEINDSYIKDTPEHDNSLYFKNYDNETPENMNINNIQLNNKNDEYENQFEQLDYNNVHSKVFRDYKIIYNKPLEPLDYRKIKSLIQQKVLDVATLCSILQALSWRLEYTNKQASKEQLEDMSEMNIFDLGVYDFYVNKPNSDNVNISIILY